MADRPRIAVIGRMPSGKIRQNRADRQHHAAQITAAARSGRRVSAGSGSARSTSNRRLKGADAKAADKAGGQRGVLHEFWQERIGQVFEEHGQEEKTV